jgi:hypothetical protein
MIMPQFHNCFLCYHILLYNQSILPNQHILRSRDILDIPFPNHGQELSFEVAGLPISFLASVSSGTRHSIAQTILYGATLTVEAPSNPDHVRPLFIALLYLISRIHSLFLNGEARAGEFTVLNWYQ